VVWSQILKDALFITKALFIEKRNFRATVFPSEAYIVWNLNHISPCHLFFQCIYLSEQKFYEMAVFPNFDSIGRIKFFLPAGCSFYLSSCNRRALETGTVEHCSLILHAKKVVKTYWTIFFFWSTDSIFLKVKWLNIAWCGFRMRIGNLMIEVL